MSGNTNKIIDEFDKKLLEKIDQQLMHIEAIKNYDPVKAERDELKEERDDLRGKLAEAHNTISRYKESTGRLDQQLREEKEKVDNLARHNKVLTARVEKLEGVEMAFFEGDKGGPASGMKGDDAARSVTGRHGENIAGGRGDEGSGTERQSSSPPPPQPRVINLAEAERRFLKAKEEDIKRRAEEQLNSIKHEWERIEKPKLVTEAAAQALRGVVDYIIIGGAQTVKKAVGGIPSLPSQSISSEQQPATPSSAAMWDQELYTKVRSILDNRVKQGLDYEFERRVEAELQNRAEEKFKQIANTEWPNYYNQNILPLANELQRMILGNVFNFLAGPWTITCKICGAAHRSRALSPEEVESLISTKTLEFQCYGAYLRSQVNWLDKLSGTAHTFRIGLLELIQDRLVPEQEDGEEEAG
jgi:cell division septum initiation protein DivIVA